MTALIELTQPAPPHVVSDDEVWIVSPIPGVAACAGHALAMATTAIGIWQGSSWEQSRPACHMTKHLQLPQRMPVGVVWPAVHGAFGTGFQPVCH